MLDRVLEPDRLIPALRRDCHKCICRRLAEALMRFLLSLLVATAVSPAITVVAPKTPEPGANAQVCKTQRSLSSRVVKRVCKTAAEWRNESMAARNKLKLGPKSQTTEVFKPPAGQ
ncbi:MAG TPA: hypothetical protein VFK50_04695 [Sphingomicrobium sp.]|nr:hypothetical protein [Sphingomicrobium sp.]